jgi:hypothetical protein
MSSMVRVGRMGLSVPTRIGTLAYTATGRPVGLAMEQGFVCRKAQVDGVSGVGRQGEHADPGYGSDVARVDIISDAGVGIDGVGDDQAVEATDESRSMPVAPVQ